MSAVVCSGCDMGALKRVISKTAVTAVAASPADKGKKARILSVASRAQNRLRETFGDLDEYEVDVQVDADTKQTLRQYLEAQITKEDNGEDIVRESGKTCG